MPSKKKKYNARFPAGRIKKIMQSDEEIGKVAQAVPVVISRTLELFVESLLTKTLKITNSRNARTLSTSHMKQCIMSENRFDFLRELVKNIPDISVAEEAANYNEDDVQSSPEQDQYPDMDTPYDLSMPSTSTQASRALCVTSNGSNSSFRAQNNNRNAGGGSDTAAGLHAMDLRGDRSKLSRADSTPLASGTPAVHCLRQRLKHQSQSVPGNSNASSASHNNYNNNDKTPPKRKVQGLEEETPQPPALRQQYTAINAPIVSYDFCNKPVVKIDYSKLPFTAEATQSPIAPQSAPADMGLSGVSAQHASAFHFSAEPVISIDLSNIVTEAAMKAAAEAPPVNVTLGAATILATTSPSSTTTISHLKASMAPPLRSNSCGSSSGSSTGALALKSNNNSFFELDEDYDNI